MHELNKQNSLATLETIEEVISAFKSIDDLHRALALGYIPVSYTHLDVYKRQT